MMASTHIALALVAAKFVYTPAQPLDWALVGLGAIAPDFDAGGGMITKPSRFLPVPRIIGKPVDIVTRLASQATREAIGHRGPLHWPIVALGLWLLAGAVGWPWLRFIAVGYIAHIVADGFTRSGVPLLGPLSSRDFGFLPKKLRIKTGGAIEKLLQVVLWWYVIWVLLGKAVAQGKIMISSVEEIVHCMIDTIMNLTKQGINYFL